VRRQHALLADALLHLEAEIEAAARALKESTKANELLLPSQHTLPAEKQYHAFVPTVVRAEAAFGHGVQVVA
jgi:hypothetical protein